MQSWPDLQIIEAQNERDFATKGHQMMGGHYGS